MPFSRSRSPESMTRSTTVSAWCSVNAPAWRSMASTRVVLPWSTWATIATLRRSGRGGVSGTWVDVYGSGGDQAPHPVIGVRTARPHGQGCDPLLRPAVPPARELAATARRAAGSSGSLALDEELRLRAAQRSAPRPVARPLGAAPAWVVHTAGDGHDLPGRGGAVRRRPESGDVAVDEAADGVAGALALFEEVYGRASYDGAGAHAWSRPCTTAATTSTRSGTAPSWCSATATARSSTGSPSRSTCSATSSRTPSTEHTAGLVYQGQSGRAQRVGLRRLRRLPQAAAARPDRRRGRLADRCRTCSCPASRRAGCATWPRPGRRTTTRRSARTRSRTHMDDYVETTDDNGGVHLNSGIPNRAFHLAAVAIGGSSAEGAGRIWYAALTGGAVGAADRLRRVRGGDRRRGGRARRRGRRGLGDGRRHPGRVVAPRPVSRRRRRAARRPSCVRRSGGFLGRTVAGEVDLDGDDAARRRGRRPGRPRRPAHGRRRPPKPDMYVYDFDLCGDCATVPEQHLTARPAPDRRPGPGGGRPAGAIVRDDRRGPAGRRPRYRHGLSRRRARRARGRARPRRAGWCTGRPGCRSRPGGPAARARCSRG